MRSVRIPHSCLLIIAAELALRSSAKNGKPALFLSKAGEQEVLEASAAPLAGGFWLALTLQRPVAPRAVPISRRQSSRSCGIQSIAFVILRHLRLPVSCCLYLDLYIPLCVCYCLRSLLQAPAMYMNRNKFIVMGESNCRKMVSTSQRSAAAPLPADHHTSCKFGSQIGVLKCLLNSCQSLLAGGQLSRYGTTWRLRWHPHRPSSGSAVSPHCRAPRTLDS
jgi:hypothetical protein